MASSQLPPRRNRRGTNSRGGTKALVNSRDLDTMRITGYSSPPQHVANPAVSRRVRFQAVVSPSGITLTITAASVIAQDQAEYVASAGRYGAVRVNGVEVWLAESNPGTSATSSISVSDTSSGAVFTDTLGRGIDWAHVALRRSLGGRVNWIGFASTSPISVIIVPPNTAFIGQLVVDVSCDFC